MTMDRWIERQMRRLRFGRFLERGAEWWAGFLFAFGAAVLASKLVWPALWPHVLWGALGVVPVSFVIWVRARREAHTRREAVALLDQQLGTGGLLMTLSESPDERWAQRLPVGEHLWSESLPKLRPERLARYLALPLIFAMGACLVPVREARTLSAAPRTVGPQATQRLSEMLEALDEASVLEPEEQRQLEAEIEQLADQTNKAPLTHEKWETLDALRERLQMRLNTAELTVSKAQSALAALAGIAGDEGGLLSVEQNAELQKHVLEALQKMGATGALSQAPAGLREELQRLVQSGEFKLPADAAEQRQMFEQLQEYLSSEAERLSEHRGRFAESGRVDGLASTRGESAGGGITRGSGDAPLTFGEENTELKKKFKEIALPPGYFDEARPEPVGVSLAEPEEQAAESSPRNAPREAAAATGGESWNRELRPRHRRIVRRYFGH